MEQKMEFIDRQAVFKEINRRLRLSSLGETIETRLSNTEILAILSTAPIVDAAPVVHGRWIVTKGNGTSTIFTCSECSREVEATNDYFGKPTEHIAKIYPFCHCGAKMDLKEREN